MMKNANIRSWKEGGQVWLVGNLVLRNNGVFDIAVLQITQSSGAGQQIFNNPRIQRRWAGVAGWKPCPLSFKMMLSLTSPFCSSKTKQCVWLDFC
jgi:hypothetical protein